MKYALASAIALATTAIAAFPTLAQPAFNLDRWVQANHEPISSIPDWSSRSYYPYAYVDLDGDNTDEIVIGVFDPMCGSRTCPFYVLQWDGSTYATLSKLTIESAGGEIYGLSTSTNGMQDLAIPQYPYDTATYPAGHYLYRFDGETYQNTRQLAPTTGRTVLLDADRN